MQELAECVFAFERDLALADPLQDRVAPKPVGKQSFVLFSQLERQLETPLLEYVGRGVSHAQHVVCFAKHGFHVFYGRVFGGGMNQKRGKLVCPTAWYLDVPCIAHVRVPDPVSIVQRRALLFHCCSTSSAKVN